MTRMIPWETPEKYVDLDKALTYVAIAVVLFLLLYSTQVNIGNASSTQNFSIIYLAIMLAVGYSAMRDKKNYGGFGTKENIIKGIGLGAVAAAFMLFSTSIKLSSPLASTVSDSQILSYFYVAFVVPLVEEKFFSQTMPFILGKSIESPLIVKIVVSIAFGLFHAIAYAASLPLMLTAMGFRFAVLYGNEMLKTATFGLSLHWINNIVGVAKAILAMG